jgi:hypothetical protein
LHPAIINVKHNINGQNGHTDVKISFSSPAEGIGIGSLKVQSDPRHLFRRLVYTGKIMDVVSVDAYFYL